MSVQEALSGLYQDISKVVIGKSRSVILTLTAVLCRGHLLIEDYPGLGKTLLAHSVARGLALDFKRIQCTPDLLPADVTGGAIFRHSNETFEFIKGPVFTDILLVDEINRSSPRTQSSLLEAMAENQVTAEGETYELSNQFLIIATQNPVELHGTFPLPEAQLDRFFMRIDMGYPDVESELKILHGQGPDQKIEIEPRIDREALTQLQRMVHKIPVKPEISRYCLDIVRATREHDEIALGVSPRGSIALHQAAQAFAMITNKNLVTPQVVKNVAEPVLSHRITLRQQKGDHHARAAMIRKVLSTVPVP